MPCSSLNRVDSTAERAMWPLSGPRPLTCSARATCAVLPSCSASGTLAARAGISPAQNSRKHSAAVLLQRCACPADGEMHN